MFDFLSAISVHIHYLSWTFGGIKKNFSTNFASFYLIFGNLNVLVMFRTVYHCRKAGKGYYIFLVIVFLLELKFLWNTKPKWGAGLRVPFFFVETICVWEDNLLAEKYIKPILLGTVCMINHLENINIYWPYLSDSKMFCMFWLLEKENIEGVRL